MNIDTLVHDYFLSLAQSSQYIFHDGSARYTYCSSYDECVRNWKRLSLDRLITILDIDQGNFENNGGDTELDRFKCSLHIFRKVKEGDFQAYDAAYAEAKTVMVHLLSRIYHDRRALVSPARYLDKSRKGYERIEGDFPDIIRGYRLDLEWEYGQSLVYNAQEWS